MISPLGRGVSQGGGSAPAQNQVIALRVAVIGAVLLALFAVVFFRLWYLQVLSGDSLSAAASKNRARSVAITAPRGEIVDRTGHRLVRNRRAQIIELAPASLPSLEKQVAAAYGKALGDWRAQLVKTYGSKRVTKWKAIPASALARFPKPTITPLTDASLVRDYVADDAANDLAALKERYARLGKVLRLPATEIRRRVITSLYLLPYASIPLSKKSAPDDVVAYVAENAQQFPGVSTTYKTVRSYKYRGAGAQLFGQVGAVPVFDSGPNKGKSKLKKYRSLNTASLVGVNGLELEYDGYLRGKDGKVKTTVDAQGNVLGTPETILPTRGDTLQLTLDLALQRKARNLLDGGVYNPSGNPGAIVAIDPRNGEVLASQSNPTFDPNVFVRGVSESDFQKFIDENGGKPLFNRVTDSGYAAGSTFKPVTAFAEISQGVFGVDEIFHDVGKLQISDQKLQNAGAAALGDVDLRKALQLSSDVYFYHQGELLNKPSEPLQSWARKLGYGQATGIDLPGESTGIVPDRKWRLGLSDKERACRAKKKIPQGPNYSVYAAAAQGCGITDMRTWSVGDNVNLAIGQGDVQVTPLQSAVAYAAIANGGDIVRPHLAKALQDRDGATRQVFQFPIKKHVDLKATGALDAIRNGLYDAANVGGGTSAAVFKNWPRDRYPVFGKTGTVQKQGKKDQSWYACYVPDPKHPIVVVATVEAGGFGAETAAPMAGEMLKQWFGLQDVEIVKGDSKTL
jgi:penicillin-binding protein 2